MKYESSQQESCLEMFAFFIILPVVK
uniref:Uncharacterized protein n=1 Tax=Anguilla anguilla TaxID=7936 RepID=A0A0E9RGM9_ANGAN